jgi:hypothetical protein
MRHAVLDQWLTQKRKIDFVMEHLVDANFDPEFYSRYEKQIIAQFNADLGTSLQLKKKDWRRIFQKTT